MKQKLIKSNQIFIYIVQPCKLNKTGESKTFELEFILT